jgi:outer membrane protein
MMDRAVIPTRCVQKVASTSCVLFCALTVALMGFTARSVGEQPNAPVPEILGIGELWQIQRLPSVEPVVSHDALQRLPETGAARNSELSMVSPEVLPVLPEPAREPDPESLVPGDAAPWWQAQALRPLGQSPTTIPVDVSSLIVEALRHSARVRAISDTAVIAETSITRADAEFNTRAFMESKFNRTSVPTGSTLDAGFNVPRLREEDWFYNAGFRNKNQRGGRLEAAQRIGIRDSNSNFFFPDNQGNSRLTLSYNQPLLNGAGVAYNTSLIVLANFDTRIAINRSAAELQEYLLEVTELHWQLYLQRCLLLQQQMHVARAEAILAHLERRRTLDSLDNQITRAQAAVALRRTALIRANTSIRNAESRLRSLVNSPHWTANRSAELVPIQAPSGQLVAVDLQLALLTALEHRPEIDAATQEIEAARVRLNVARNELLPALNVVLETYVSGLRGDYNVGQSLQDQFSVGEPSYTAGLLFDVPLGLRAAKANETRRRAELRQLLNRFQETMEKVNAEVEIAVREVETAHTELQAKHQSMRATAADMQYLQRRWETLPGEDGVASFVLQDLLDAQERLALAEFSFAQGQTEYALSNTRLNRALGTLLIHEQVAVLRGSEQGIPTIQFEKRGTMMETRTP